jgi:zinc transport system substrate-binding protein
MSKLLGILAALVLTAACAPGPAEPAGRGAPRLVASFYPLAFAATRIAGDRAEVVDLTPAGVEPHDLELSPSQVRALAEADLVVYVGGGFQPGVEQALEQVDTARLDVLELVETLPAEDEPAEDEHGKDEHAHGAVDPHVWLDPMRLAEIGEAIATELGAIDPAGRAIYGERAAALTTELDRLDRAFREGLKGCEQRAIVVSHQAFGYLTESYGLKQVGIAGLDPEAEPSPARVAQVTEFARANGVTTIFFETLVSPRVAKTIANEIGIDTAVLDPLESQPDGGDYLSGMRANLAALRAALGCP